MLGGEYDWAMGKIPWGDEQWFKKKVIIWSCEKRLFCS